jgi:hypothetical protein
MFITTVPSASTKATSSSQLTGAPHSAKALPNSGCSAAKSAFTAADAAAAAQRFGVETWTRISSGLTMPSS